jgi:spore coat protein CotF
VFSSIFCTKKTRRDSTVKKQEISPSQKKTFPKTNFTNHQPTPAKMREKIKPTTKEGKQEQELMRSGEIMMEKEITS